MLISGFLMYKVSVFGVYIRKTLQHRAGAKRRPDAWCDIGAARPKIRRGKNLREEGSFPDLGDTVREAGA